MSDPEASAREEELFRSQGGPLIQLSQSSFFSARILSRLRQALGSAGQGKGGNVAHGRVASALPQICDVWLKARDAGVLKAAQQAIATKADMLMRGLAHTGIIALVDEATGYQEVTDRRALQEILDKFIGKELAKWAKRFPDGFMSRCSG